MVDNHRIHPIPFQYHNKLCSACWDLFQRYNIDAPFFLNSVCLQCILISTHLFFALVGCVELQTIDATEVRAGNL